MSIPFSAKLWKRVTPALLTLMAGTLLLNGCTTVSPYDQALKNVTPIYTWNIHGQMTFECAYDEQGFYWKFLKTSGQLTDDQGQYQGKVLANYTIEGRDQTKIPNHIIAQKTSPFPNNLSDVVFEVATPADSGLFKNVKYVERRNAKGGMPLVSCSAAQRHQLLNVKYSGRYIFYR